MVLVNTLILVLVKIDFLADLCIYIHTCSYIISQIYLWFTAVVEAGGINIGEFENISLNFSTKVLFPDVISYIQCEVTHDGLPIHLCRNIIIYYVTGFVKRGLQHTSNIPT